jgi:hypothetical protein
MHEPALHVDPVGHPLPQIPQLFTSVSALVSQPAAPEQWRYPALQVNPHSPVLHAAVAFW